MRLASEKLGRISGPVQLPEYDRDAQASGIVHIGIGAFHRGHQAWYADACLNAGEHGWMITGVSMRSASMAERLAPQSGLYTLTERTGASSNIRVIGAVRDVLVAQSDRARVINRLASPDTQIVTFTVTEKGYCRAADGSLDRDLAGSGFYPLLSEAMRRRKQAGAGGLTLLSCDNLASNGKQLGGLMRAWLESEAPEVVDWFAAHCTTPDSMVDRIVPATTEADLAELEVAIGQRDEGAVFTEPFSQWVIEDHFAGPRPRWEDHGAQIVPDVAPYETAKLRMLNGAHSLLAYCGLRAGYTFVHEAVGDAHLRALASRLMREAAAPTIRAGAGQNLDAYADALLARFDNAALNHRLMQIAMDGSQKIPQRWLETLAAHQAKGATCPPILEGLAAWVAHLRGANGPVDDPRADALAQAAVSADPVAALFGQGGLFASSWQPTDADRRAINGFLG